RYTNHHHDYHLSLHDALPISRQRGEAVEPEDALEERRRAIADRAGALVAAGLGDQAALDEARDGRVGGDAADPCDLGSRDRAEVDRKSTRLNSSHVANSYAGF